MSNQSPLITKFETRLTKDEDKHLSVYDHTALSAINTCLTWGIIRYVKHLRMGGTQRQMPLEAGEAAHQVFAAYRLYKLLKAQHREDLALYHGKRLFSDRYQALLDKLDSGATERTNCINFCLEALYTSGFYDDPSDKFRTLDNLAEATIVFIDSQPLDKNPVWIRDESKSDSDVGIEIPFDLVVNIETDLDCVGDLQFRYAGKLDGIHVGSRGIFVEDNKTGARIDDAWLAQWRMSHQLTGYCVAVSTWTEQTCSQARVAGMKIPIGKDLSSGIRNELVPREPYHFEAFAKWLVHTISLIQQYQDNPLDAPRYTHSCNRYFRACSFLPLCDSSEEEQRLSLSQMVTDEWSPLKE